MTAHSNASGSPAVGPSTDLGPTADLGSTTDEGPTPGVDPVPGPVGINEVLLIGEITRAPFVRELDSGTVLATLTVRVPGTAGKRTSLPITWWDPPEWVGDLAEGMPCEVSGTVIRRFWAGPDGARRTRLEILAERVEAPAASGS